MSIAELDTGFQGYGYQGEMSLDPTEINRISDDYAGSMVQERQSYHDHY